MLLSTISSYYFENKCSKAFHTRFVNQLHFGKSRPAPTTPRHITYGRRSCHQRYIRYTSVFAGCRLCSRACELVVTSVRWGRRSGAPVAAEAEAPNLITTPLGRESSLSAARHCKRRINCPSDTALCSLLFAQTALLPIALPVTSSIIQECPGCQCPGIN